MSVPTRVPTLKEDWESFVDRAIAGDVTDEYMLNTIIKSAFYSGAYVMMLHEEIVQRGEKSKGRYANADAERESRYDEIRAYLEGRGK